MISFPNHCVHKLAASIVTLSVVLLVLPASFTVAQSSTLFSWQGAISPPVVTNQVWGDHHLFEKGTGYKEFAIEINQGNGAEITATASGTLSLYVVPDEYAASWYWVGDYYPGSDYTIGDTPYICQAQYSGSSLNVRFWAPKDDTWHFVFYNEGTSDIDVSLQAVLLEPVKVSINLSPSDPITYGQSVTISGTVTSSDPQVPNGNIALMLTQGYGQDQTLANVAPQNGQYSYQWTPDAGTHTIYAAWSGNGDYQPATSQQLQITVNKMPVTLQVGQIAKVELDPLFQSPVNVTIAGQITPSLQGAHLTIALGPTFPEDQLTQNMLYPFGQSTSPQFDTVTDANGRFTMQIPIAKPGAWQVVVAWDGDANHLGFSQTVTIEAEWNYTPYIIELLLVLLSATLIVYKTRKRILTKSGKTPLSASSIQETSRTREITEKARKARELLDSQLITKDEFDLLMKDERDHD